jgi:hypothetical protein
MCTRRHEYTVRARVWDTASGAEPGRPGERRRDPLDGVGSPRLVLEVKTCIDDDVDTGEVEGLLAQGPRR